MNCETPKIVERWKNHSSLIEKDGLAEFLGTHTLTENGLKQLELSISYLHRESKENPSNPQLYGKATEQCLKWSYWNRLSGNI